MVYFEDDKLVIELKTANKIDSIDTWVELHDALFDLMRYLDRDSISDSFHAIPNFMEQLFPDFEVLRKMTD